MLIASFLIYFTSEFLWERPSGEPKLLMLLPGLSFVEPGWWRLVLGVKNLNGIEGSFWTLYAEMKFYVFAAIIYYRFGRTPMIVSLFFVYLLSVAMHFLANLDESVYFATLDKVFNSLSFTHFGWFSAGSAYYVFYKNRDWRWRCIALSFSVVSSVFVRDHSFESIMAALLMSGLFFLSMTNAGFQNILSNRLFLFFGFISYPLYLIHDNAMISLILKSSRYDIGIPYFFIPFIPVVILALFPLRVGR